MLSNIFLVSFVLGGVLLAASLLGDLLDIDALTDSVDGDGLSILTIRGLTYLLFVSGAVGYGLLELAGIGAVPATAIAVAAGAGVSAMVGRVFRYLRRTEAGMLEQDDSLRGLPAEVVVPISARGGKISLRRGSERLELLARPFDESDGDPAAWRHVRIIEISQGTALVVPNQPDQ